MKLALTFVTLLAVMLASTVNMNLATPTVVDAPTDDALQPGLQVLTPNITGNSTEPHKAEMSSGDIFLIIIFIVITASGVCSVIQCMWTAMCEKETISRAAWHRMQVRDRDRMNFNQKPPRRSPHRDISFPVNLLPPTPAPDHVFTQDPFFLAVQENLRDRYRSEVGNIRIIIHGPQNPKKVTISSPRIADTYV